jgi:hypothetical protein
MKRETKMSRELRSSNLLFCCLFYFPLRSSRSRRASCNSSRGTSGDNSSNGRRCSPLKGLFGSCPFGGEEYCGVGAPPSVPNLHQQFGAHLVERLMTMWGNLQRGDLVINVLPHLESEAPFGAHRPRQYTAYAWPVCNVVQQKLSSHPLSI